MKTKLAHPLISCICITERRPIMLMKAIFGFMTQNYPNKELVISYLNEDQETMEVISKVLAYTDQKITLVERQEKVSLGTARNQAVAKASGEYICTWDDDDLNHYGRIMHQFDDMQHNYVEAGLLSRIFLYDTMTQKGYYPSLYNWGGTLICKKELILQYPYIDTNVAEDAQLISSLESSHILHKIADSPHLYTFIYHQKNATDYLDFQYFIYHSYLLTEKVRDFIRREHETEYAFRDIQLSSIYFKY